MSYRIVWSDKAADQLDAIHSYLCIEAPHVADGIIDDILSTPDKLMGFPKLGQVEFSLNEFIEYRYLVYSHWKIIYMVHEQTKKIVVVTLFDTRQNPIKIWKGISF